MRKILHKRLEAFENGDRLSKGNMLVADGAMYLHGNKIAEWRDGALWITSAGWETNTTKERLNGLRGVSINQKAFQWYLNGVKWDGEWVKVAGYGQEDKKRTSFLIN